MLLKYKLIYHKISRQLHLNKETFDQHYPSRLFLHKFNQKEIVNADPDVLCHIIKKDVLSFIYIYSDQQHIILNKMDKSWFTLNTFNKLMWYNCRFNKGLFEQYFNHIPLYILYDKD